MLYRPILNVMSVLFLLGAGVFTPAQSKAYPVDCAILLCLAGGWPASVECAHARFVFIRRITPWPIEPPLQIWRCPMGVSTFQAPAPIDQVIPIKITQTANGADVDISAVNFDFVRSIRVWDVRHYSHRERGLDDDCSEQFVMRLGTYGPQGAFTWAATTPRAAPRWVIPTRRCFSQNSRRGVGVEWTDHAGNHGYEWVAY